MLVHTGDQVVFLTLILGIGEYVLHVAIDERLIRIHQVFEHIWASLVKFYEASVALEADFADFRDRPGIFYFIVI